MVYRFESLLSGYELLPCASCCIRQYSERAFSNSECIRRGMERLSCTSEYI